MMVPAMAYITISQGHRSKCPVVRRNRASSAKNTKRMPMLNAHFMRANCGSEYR